MTHPGKQAVDNTYLAIERARGLSKWCTNAASLPITVYKTAQSYSISDFRASCDVLAFIYRFCTTASSRLMATYRHSEKEARE